METAGNQLTWKEYRLLLVCYLWDFLGLPEAGQWRLNTLLLVSTTFACWHQELPTCCGSKKILSFENIYFFIYIFNEIQVFVGFVSLSPLLSPSPQRNLVHKYYNSSEQKSVLVSNYYWSYIGQNTTARYMPINIYETHYFIILYLTVSVLMWDRHPRGHSLVPKTKGDKAIRVFKT